MREGKREKKKKGKKEEEKRRGMKEVRCV